MDKGQVRILDFFLKEARENAYTGDSTVIEDDSGCLRISRWVYEDGYEIRYDLIIKPDGTWHTNQHEGIMYG